MITGISIENFKGIGEQVDLEIRPITLLFGGNSAGKSSIIHALHYAKEIFERHQLNPDTTVAGGKYVNLGGFQTFVHEQDLTKSIHLGFSIDLTKTQLPDFIGGVRPATGVVEPLLGKVSSARIGITIAWSQQQNDAYVTAYRVWFNNAWIGSITTQLGRKGCELRVNTSHPCLLPVSEIDEPLWPNQELDDGHSALFSVLDSANNIAEILPNLGWEEGPPYHNEDGSLGPEGYIAVIPLGQMDALPAWNDRLSLPLEWPEDTDHAPEDIDHYMEWVSVALSQIMVGPGQLVSDFLATLRYLGPLRETPPRSFRPPLSVDDSRWSSGLGAWDALQNDPEGLVRTVSDWLGDEDKLNAGYRVERRGYFEVDQADPIVVQLSSGRVFDDIGSDLARLDINKFPLRQQLKIIDVEKGLDLDAHDVGTGISQVVPVVVTALDEHHRLLAIEQPELHLHPRLQAELGDLFIEAALGERQQQVILETHSEHLILRLLRRIRETTSGDLPVNKSELTSGDVAVFYVERTDEGTRVTPLAIDESGEFIDRWPQGFFAERAEELF